MEMAHDSSKRCLSARRQSRPMWWDPSRASCAAEDRQRLPRSDAIPQWQAVQRLSQRHNPVHPSATGRPVIQSGPFAAWRPAIQSGPFATGRPLFRSGPVATGQPTIQSGPFATRRPVIQSGAFATGRPVIQSSPFPTGRPVIQSDPFLTGRLIIQSNPFATERPVIQSERNHWWPCGGHRGIGNAGGCCAVLCAPPQAPQREQGRDDPRQQGGAWE